MSEINVNIIKSLQVLKKELDTEIFSQLLNSLGLPENDYERRIEGLNIEYEFLCNLYLCNFVKSIIPIDEEFTTSVGEKSCDAIVELNDGKRIMIEIKSTEKNEYTISGGNFQKRVDRANDKGFQLYFAIKMYNYWTLFSSDQIAQWGRKVDVSKFQYSLLSSVLNVCYYIVQNVKMATTFTDNILCQSLGIMDEDNVHFSIKEQFFVNGKLVEEITPQNKCNLTHVLLSEALRERAEIKKAEINEHEYTKTYEIKETNIISSFDIFKETIVHMEGTDEEEKYKMFMSIISRDPDRKVEINSWIKSLAQLLNMCPMKLLPTPEKSSHH